MSISNNSKSKTLQPKITSANKTQKPQLHLIQQTLDSASFARQFKRLVSNGDSLLFLNDAVFCLIKNDFGDSLFKKLVSNTTILVIDEQIESRGIISSISPISIINYSQFVKLSIQANKIISW